MITLTIHDYDNDSEEEVSFPSKKEVCSECNGEGYVLIEGLRGHAFSREEFEESFYDDEDREAYFTRGGKYDQLCPCCKGKNVVDVVDETMLTADQKEQYKVFREQEEDRARSEAEDRATMRAECGGYY